MSDRAPPPPGDVPPAWELSDIERCFGGAIPAVLATAAPDGTGNVTYISRAHRVDHERVALSNQFMSKTARNLVANPRADLVLMDPVTHDEFRLALVYERTERRGPVFERLRADLEVLAAEAGMQDVFRLRAADIFRVTAIERLEPHPSGASVDETFVERSASDDLDALATLTASLSRAGDLDVLLDVALEGLDRLLGHRHTQFLLLDDDGRRLTVIASRGYDDAIGAQVDVGVGQIGTAAARCEAVRAGSLVQSTKYSQAIRSSVDGGGVRPGRDLPLAGLLGANSRLAVPAMARGELVGVLVAESTRPTAYSPGDEQVLGVVAAIVASAVELDRSPLGTDDATPEVPVVPHEVLPDDATPGTVHPAAGTTTLRFFEVDGSVFLGTDYLIKGVAGRILWSLVRQYLADGRTEFTNRELRLDPTLDLPGFKDNLESRLILLKRRLDERAAPVRIDKTGRGRFRLVVTPPITAEPG